MKVPSFCQYPAIPRSLGPSATRVNSIQEKNERKATPPPAPKGLEVEAELPPSQVFNQQDHKAQFVSCLVTTTTDLVQHIWPNSANADPLPLDKFIEEVLRRSRMSYSTLQTALYYIAVLLRPALIRLGLYRLGRDDSEDEQDEQDEDEEDEEDEDEDEEDEDEDEEDEDEEDEEDGMDDDDDDMDDDEDDMDDDEDDEDNHPHPQQKRPHQKQLPSPLLCGRRMFLTALILATKYLQDKTYSLKAWSKMSGLRIAEIVALERLFLQTVQWNLHIPATKFRCFTSSILKYTEARFSRCEGGGTLGNSVQMCEALLKDAEIASERDGKSMGSPNVVKMRGVEEKSQQGAAPAQNGLMLTPPGEG